MASSLPHLDDDSVSPSPRSDHFQDAPPRVRFMCSFGGKILPRPSDNQLRYVGGDTRIVAVNRSIPFSALVHKLSKLCGMSNITAKYQLPNEDLDALITVTTDEDVENMIDEYDRVSQNENPRAARLRVFLFPEGEDSRANSISSLLNGSTKRENWFMDALNGGVSGLERGRSEASSMLSEVPDYLFGLDNNSEETNQNQILNLRESRPKERHLLQQDNVSNSDPGSPAPVVSSPFCSTSSALSVPSIPNLPPVKTKLENPVSDFRENQNETVFQPQLKQNLYQINPAVHYPHPQPQAQASHAQEAAYSGHHAQPVPVYYISGSVQPGNMPMQQVHYPFVQQPYHAVMQPQVPIGYHHMVPGSGQVYGAGMRHVAPVQPYSPTAAVVRDGLKQQVYQGVPNPSPVPVYHQMAVTGGDEPQRSGTEFGMGRGTNPPNN
ncbi:hypothetical protein RYX36_035068 [Vicia faba]